jgi:hypothetical protein
MPIAITALNIKPVHFTVRTFDELQLILKKAQKKQVIYIADDAKIDLTGHPKIVIPEGVTIASGRGVNGSKGALFFTKDLGHSPAFLVTGKNVRITGIRLKGPDTTRRVEQMYNLIAKNDYYSLPNSYGIQCYDVGQLEIDNCELWGWSYGAISLRDSHKNHIHHNYIHHNQRLGLGYGIMLDRANALIEHNYFDWNRHSVSGSGRLNTSYIVRYNFFGLNSLNYVIDMHSIKDETLNKQIAGSEILIYNNTFLTEEDGTIGIHGNPTKTIQIYNNAFNAYSRNKEQLNVKAEKSLVQIKNNVYFKRQGDTVILHKEDGSVQKMLLQQKN